MSYELEAVKVLQLARNEILKEMAASGANGGTGRILNQAPNFVNVQNALNLLTDTPATRGPGRPAATK